MERWIDGLVGGWVRGRMDEWSHKAEERGLSLGLFCKVHSQYCPPAHTLNEQGQPLLWNQNIQGQPDLKGKRWKGMFLML